MDIEKIRDSNADLYQLLYDRYLIDKFAHQFYETVDIRSDVDDKMFELFNHVKECYERLSSRYKENEKIVFNQIQYAIYTLIRNIYPTCNLASDSAQKIDTVNMAFIKLSTDLLDIFDRHINRCLNPYTVSDTLKLLNSIRQGHENNSLIEQSKKKIENERKIPKNLVKSQDNLTQIICENDSKIQITVQLDPIFFPGIFSKNTPVNQQTQSLSEIRQNNQLMKQEQLIPEFTSEIDPKNLLVNQVPMQTESLSINNINLPMQAEPSLREICQKNQFIKQEQLIPELTSEIGPKNAFVNQVPMQTESMTINNINLPMQAESLLPEIVYFDLETNTNSYVTDILQISARSKNRVFNVFINSSMVIDEKCTKKTRLHHVEPLFELFRGEVKLDTVPIKDALQQFYYFLLEFCVDGNKCLLVADNASANVSRLLRAIHSNNVVNQFEVVISGFSDVNEIFRLMFPERNTAKKSLKSLANDYLPLLKPSAFDDAEFDTVVLEKLVETFNCKDHLLKNSRTYSDKCRDLIINLQKNDKSPGKIKYRDNLRNLLQLKDIVSDSIRKKMAEGGMNIDFLVNYFDKFGRKGLEELFCTPRNNPKVTKQKKIIKSACDFIETESMKRKITSRIKNTFLN